MGIAVDINALSRGHRDHLAAGSSGFVLGDGRLDHGHEPIAEIHCAFQPMPRLTFSPDFQLISNAGYHRDRGPAHFIGIRAPFEY